MKERTKEGGIVCDGEDRTETNGPEHVLEYQEYLLQQVDDGEATDEVGTSVFCSQRWIMAYMGLLYGTVSYILRVNMSVAIVSMADTPTFNITGYDVSNTTSHAYNDDVPNGRCERLSLGAVAEENKPAEFDWDKTTQSLVLSSFFYGYMATQIPGGLISGRYGGRHVISVTTAISSLVTLLIPICSRTHVYLTIAVRVVLGLCMGAGFPSLFALVGVWALPNERSRFMAMYWFGQVLGTISGYTSTGYLCVAGFDNGWGSVFYIHGIIGIIFTICWVLLVFDSPDQHPRIQDGERNILRKVLQHRRNEKKPDVPWVSILTSVSTITIYITHAADAWLLYLLLTCLPLFMNDVLNFDISSNGVFSSLPFLTMAIGLAVSGVLADYISSRKWLRLITTRKLLQVSGNVLAATFILISGYISCDRRIVVIICLCLCTFSEAIGVGAGYPCSPLDIAPRFASVIMGISNTIASIPGILSPVVVAEMTQNSTQEEWRHVFFLTAGIVGVATVVYGLGASSDLAPWSGQEPIEVEIDVLGQKTIQKESPLVRESPNGLSVNKE